VDPIAGRDNPTVPGATDGLYWELVELMEGSVKLAAAEGACRVLDEAIAGRLKETAATLMEGSWSVEVDAIAGSASEAPPPPVTA